MSEEMEEPTLPSSSFDDFLPSLIYYLTISNHICERILLITEPEPVISLSTASRQ